MANSVEEFLQSASYEKVDVGNVIVNTTIEELAKAVLNKQDCILFGPPGTSKTYMIDNLPAIIGQEKLGIYEIVQFHANYSYEEFVEGIVPDVEKGGFKYESGAFYRFCKYAEAIKKQDKDKLCIFVIDEINRANVTAVFGEVLNLMENKGIRTIKTPKQKLDFCIPDNVIIIGTMNTADKTLAKLDFAFRRRFRFLSVFPSKEALHAMVAVNSFANELTISVDEYVDCFEVLNAKITKHPLLGKNLTLGHVLWAKRGAEAVPYTKEDIGRIFRETIFPQIESYCGANKDVLGNLLGPVLRDKIIYGYYITDEEIIEFLSGLKNSRVVNS